MRGAVNATRIALEQFNWFKDRGMSNRRIVNAVALGFPDLAIEKGEVVRDSDAIRVLVQAWESLRS